MKEVLFIAKITVEIHRYMADSESVEEIVAIVRAEDERAAEQKVRDHYDKKCDPYCVHYSVINLVLTEEIT